MELKYDSLFYFLIFSVFFTSLFLHFLSKKRRKIYFWSGVSEISKISIFKKGRQFQRALKILESVTFSILIFILSLTASRPQRKSESIDTKNGIDIILSLDASSSMYTYANGNADYSDFDIGKSYAGQAMDVVSDFVDKLENDRVGLTIFSGNAVSLAPLTFDYSVFDYFLETLSDQRDMTMMFHRGGTATGDAIVLSVKKFEEDSDREKVIILLTDGMSNIGIDPLDAAKFASTQEIRIYTILFNDYEDNYAIKQLEESAEIAGGKFFYADRKSELDDVFEEIESLEKTEIESERNVYFYDDPELFLNLILMFGILYLGVKIWKNSKWS